VVQPSAPVVAKSWVRSLVSLFSRPLWPRRINFRKFFGQRE
jgi:hypothetical protein